MKSGKMITMDKEDTELRAILRCRNPGYAGEFYGATKFKYYVFLDKSVKPDDPLVVVRGVNPEHLATYLKLLKGPGHELDLQ